MQTRLIVSLPPHLPSPIATNTIRTNNDDDIPVVIPPPPHLHLHPHPHPHPPSTPPNPHRIPTLCPTLQLHPRDNNNDVVLPNWVPNTPPPRCIQHPIPFPV